jgi:pimeloyl-ACP methyl ester carboxylesterase
VLLTSSLDLFSNLILCHRVCYLCFQMEALGPPAFNFCGKRFTRTDFTLRTKRGYNLECSHWEPVERSTDRIPVVIYMHGNSSARLEVIPQLSYLLSLGLAVFAFDFAGSGKSDGEYVSLGYFEREDLSCIVAHLRATNVVSTVALWGRSMGAATALMFGDRDPSIACMIVDSPFADLTQLCEEMVEKAREQGVVVPGIVASLAIRMIQSSVKKQAGFNIKSISPISHADKCFIPALFVAGEHDDFIKKHHSEELHAKYAGDKNLIIVEGDHNSPRPKFLFDSASIFLQSCMQIPHDWALSVPISMNLMCPPWYFDLYEQRSARRKQAAAVRSNAVRVETGVPITIPSANNLSNGFDHDEMGMTTERQRVIQASLFKMLGQADEDGASSSTDDATSKPADLMS